MGLSAMLGTGVFVSLGLAAGVAGQAVLVAILLAGGVALCNALNSAQLAASLPVSGGTYEYGYTYLRPWLGFAAGWMFLAAKTASAAAAALGFAGYLLALLGSTDHRLINVVAAATVVVLSVVVLGGMRQSLRATWVIVSLTLVSLLVFIVAGLPTAMAAGVGRLNPLVELSPQGLLEATALVFVAYTGYGRVATLGEEVREPRRTIPRAIVATLAISAALYLGVAAVSLLSIGAEGMQAATTGRLAPLETIAQGFTTPGVDRLVALGAMTAMLGVLLNLLLGLSRVLLAMGRRGDMPAALARLNEARTTPYVAVAVSGAVVAGLAVVGNLKTTWSFSAFTVLIYYAITNLAALRLPDARRLYGRGVAWIGLAACLLLAFWLPWQTTSAGLGLLAVGLVWHVGRQRFAKGRHERVVRQH